MIAVKKEVAEEISKSLKGNKNIFVRGDFDGYKITDKELKEIEEREISDDEDKKEINKAFGVKYKSKKLINGKWRYYYTDGHEESVHWAKHEATKDEIRTFIKESYEDGNYNESIKICDFPSHFADKLKLKTGYRMTSLVFESRGIRHALNYKKHKINPEDILLLRKVIQNKHTIIRDGGKSKQQKKKLIEFTGYSRGIIKFVLEVVDSKKELRIFDCYREGNIEKSVSPLCTCPEDNALDGLQPIISINFINDLSRDIPKSNEYSTKRIKEEFQKDFTVNISDITENNKVKKIEQLEKALNCTYNKIPFKINHIPADNSTNYGSVTMRIRDFDKSKIEKAVRNLSFSLDVPLKAANGEVFYYKAQEDLTNLIVNELTNISRNIYDFIIGYLGLPERTIMSKAYLKYKGKILYSPETGEPITKKEWKKFIKTLETFLNRNHKRFGKRIVLSSRKLGQLLEEMSKYQTKDKIRKTPLSEIKDPGKKNGIDWTESGLDKLENEIKSAAEKWERARIEVAEMSAAQKITKIDDVMKNDIQQIIIDGIKNKKSKGQVSQDLFDRCANINRDIQRIADTEIQSNVNNAFINEKVKENEGTGKKTYFIRREVVDDNTCEKCKKLNGKIAVWSDTPLENEKVKDPVAEYAIWEGKDDWNYQAPNSVVHPYCRGVWDSYDPDFEDFMKDLNKDKVEKSLTWSGYKLQGRKKFAGFNVSIENKKGSYREGTDSNGHKWRVKMYHDYGYIRGTVGTDGDHLDVYLGPNENAKKVYIVHQQDPDTKKYDEDKCMLGFDTLEDAKAAYLKQYDRPGFLQSITTMDLEEFREKALKTNKGEMIKSLNAEMQHNVAKTIQEIINR